MEPKTINNPSKPELLTQKNKTMKKAILNKTATLLALLIILMAPSGILRAQEGHSARKKSDKPVRSPWDSDIFISTQTSLLLPKKTPEFVIQHRFGNLNSGDFDLAGIYGASNIRLALTYGICDRFQIGLGTTKNNKYQDLNWKVSILTQTRSGSMPLSLTYFGNVVLNANKPDYFGTEYLFAHRISYYNQLIVSRKFSHVVSLQISGSYAHYNLVDTASFPGMKNDVFGLGFAGRFRVSPQTSITLEYDQPFNTSDKVKPNLSLGVEIATSSHSFQIFLTTYRGIIPQDNLGYNTNDFLKGNILLGFNITRLWDF